MNNISELKAAFKKLKSSICYDKTQPIFRDKLVKYESEGIDNKLQKINTLLNGNETQWNNEVEKWLTSVDILVYPKSISYCSDDGLVFNRTDEQFCIDKVQHMFDSNVELQLLGVLWIMKIGLGVDKTFSNHVYGNRLKKRLIEGHDTNGASPHLFRPYFEQYESWRDEGLKIAEDFLDDGKDIIVFTMDLKRYYYNVRLIEANFNDFLNPNHTGNTYKRLNSLVYRVIKTYTDKLVAYNCSEFKNFTNIDNFACLPIGYLPSSILANWYLKTFDEGVVSRWNPLYYGRYVDDFLIVDKVEENSVLHAKAKDGSLTREEIIEYFLCNCKTQDFSKCQKDNVLMNKEEEVNEDNSKSQINYYIHQSYTPNKEKTLYVQLNKVKTFYFRSNGNKQLLQSFRKEINENRSEHRFLPEEEEQLFEQSYDNIYEIQREHGATVNRFREINNIALHRYSLSTYLGKLSYTTTLINERGKLQFEKDLLKIFDSKTIIENHIFWERLFEVLIYRKNFTIMKELVQHIYKSLDNIDGNKCNGAIVDTVESIRSTLYKVLIASIQRPLSLIWGNDVKEFIQYINELLIEKCEDFIPNIGEMNHTRKHYITTRMIKKSSYSIIVDFLSLDDDLFTDCEYFSLFNFSDCISKIIKTKDDVKLDMLIEAYSYYPYMITLQDIEYYSILYDVYAHDICNSSEVVSDQMKIKMKIFKKMNGFSFDFSENLKEEIIGMDSPICQKIIQILSTNQAEVFPPTCEELPPITRNLNIALANIKLNSNDFTNALLEQPNRSSERYGRLRKVINQAIEEKADMLILPEAYLPIEWLPRILKYAVQNKMAIVSGIEWVVVKRQNGQNVVKNLTAIVLPYTTENGDSYAHIHLHKKVHYAPSEINQIEGYGHSYSKGNSYELFCYNDFWFTVYCCYELTSIKERSYFTGLADAVIAVEWNKDINYFSNIVESLSRDMHCYCVQVNTSEFGDSRIVAPRETVLKDIVRIKGGINDAIVIGTLEVGKLREFQMKSYKLQEEDKQFKVTPPSFPVERVKMKRKKTLYTYLTNENMKDMI